MNAILLRTLTVVLSILIHASGQSKVSAALRGRGTVGKVVGLQLLHAHNGTKVADLVNGAEINVHSIPGKALPIYNIRAIISGSAQSVVFVSKSGGFTRTKNFAPYDMCSKSSSCPRLGYGTHDVTVTPYRFIYRWGRSGKPITVKFTIKQVLPTSPTKAPVAKTTRSPTKAPLANATRSPTKAPVTKATRNPTKVPVTKATRSPTKVPVASTASSTGSTRIPSKTPVAAPIKLPATPGPMVVPTLQVAVPAEAPVVPIQLSPTTSSPIARISPVFVPITTQKPATSPVPLASLPDSGIRLQLIRTDMIPKKIVMDLNFNELNSIDLQSLGMTNAQFNINAATTNQTTVQSVIFSNNWMESSVPFAFCGNSGSVFNTCGDLVAEIDMNITVTGYPLKNLQGVPYAVQWARLQIIKRVLTKEPSPTSIAPPVAAPAIPKNPPISVPTRALSSIPVLLPITAPIPAPHAAPTTKTICTTPKLSDNMWWSTPSAPYPISVAESQGSMIGNDFVIFSGFKDGYSMATTETYALDMSVASATWKRMDDMPFSKGLTHLGIAVNGMKACLCGGYVGGSLGTHDGSCFIYDHSKTAGSGQQWSTFDPLPNGGRSGGGMLYDTALNALVYAAGSQRSIAGQNSAIDYIDTWMYSLNNPSAGWVSKTNIPFHGNHMNFVTAFDIAGRERHYFFGGQLADEEERGNTATMYEYVATTDTWIQRASMPFPRGHSAAASRAIGCGFIVAGGRTNTGLTNDVTYYDILTDTWRSIGVLPVEIHTNVCVIYNGVLRCETGWAQGSFTVQRPIIM